MDLKQITKQIAVLKGQQKEMIVKMMDERPQTWLSKKTEINVSRLNACLNSTYDFSEDEINKIMKALGK